MASKQTGDIISKLCQNLDSMAYETEYSLQSVCLPSLLFYLDFFDSSNMVSQYITVVFFYFLFELMFCIMDLVIGISFIKDLH